MKSIYPKIKKKINKIFFFILEHPLLTTSIFITLNLVVGYFLIIYTFTKEIAIILEKTTATVSSMWSSVTEAHKETMHSHFRYLIMNPRVLEVLKKANSSKEQEVNLARAELYRLLWKDYEDLRRDLKVIQFHFHTPDCKSLLRFHAPYLYGDDLRKARPAVCKANEEKTPQFTFEIGKLATGFRYIFPIIDSHGNHLGSVEISRSFESLRKILSEVDPLTHYTLILNKKIVSERVIEPFNQYYIPVPKLEGWVLEKPLGEPDLIPPPLPVKYQRVFETLGENREFLKLLEKEQGGSIAVKSKGEYYKVTVLPIREMTLKEPSAVLIAIATAPVIGTITKNMFLYYGGYILIISLFSLLIHAFLKQISHIRETQERLEAITSAMGSGLLVLNPQGEITLTNETACELLGYNKKELLGKNAHQTIHHHSVPLEECPIIQAIREGRVYEGDEVFRRKDGSLFDVHVIVRPLGEKALHQGSVIVFTDISERKKLEKELYIRAITDSLTGLYNRRFQMESLLHAKKLADRYNTPFSILILDIDNFKRINDTCGHEVGDEVLRVLAKILKTQIRSTDVPARWGGEEFLILLNNTNLSNAMLTAERIRTEVANFNGPELPSFTVSIGVAQYQQVEELKDLIARADSGLYLAKSQGKNRVATLDPSYQEEVA
ncbi:MAG: diguanylate cyclase [Caldimicrobium sp.]|nr:diguanylate cyclase [Caldimicrobium sp.]